MKWISLINLSCHLLGHCNYRDRGPNHASLVPGTGYQVPGTYILDNYNTPRYCSHLAHRLQLALIILLCFAQLAAAQKDHRYLRQGDRNYKEEDLGAAEEAYRKALEARESAKGTYNLGNTVYKQGRYDEAVKHYEKAAVESRDPQARANAYHNLGNAYFQQNDYAKSAEAYKNALRLNPNDQETKINLAQALRLIPPPPPEEEQQNGESEESEEDQQEQQQQQENQSSGQEQEQEQQQQQNQQQQSEQDPSQSPAEERDLSREEAERLLQIMANEEQKTMEKLRQAQSKPCTSSKDW